MKLLIVDDEELTRTGVRDALDWPSLGIEEVYLADDGLSGLEAARKYQPEIILTDVRMPRMDGIAMCERIQEFLPDTVPVFMSGYSDKEYLKAAIRLRAVGYVEKPLDPEEIREAVREAASVHLQKLHSHRGEAQHSLEATARLASRLTLPFEQHQAEILSLMQDLFREDHREDLFTALVLRMDQALEMPQAEMEIICSGARLLFEKHRCLSIYVARRVQYLVFFIIGKEAPSDLLCQETEAYFCSCLSKHGEYFLTMGDPGQGIGRAYASYISAVILLQSSYFFPSGVLLSNTSLPEEKPAADPEFLKKADTLFYESLLTKDSANVEGFLTALETGLTENTRLLPNQVKDLYYRLFVMLFQARSFLQLPSLSDSPAIAEILERSFSYSSLHKALCSLTERFFLDLLAVPRENPTVARIREYIGQNYMVETLSVKDISNHVYLSPSYVCTFFKNETGQTLNQYLTEYRIERAKQLLSDQRYKITEVSSRVGYSDGNYFGKTFKKYTGMSPSEFRERMTQ